jgi:hypothetical protein
MIGRKRRSFSITDFIGAATFYGARFGRLLTRAAAIRGVSVRRTARRIFMKPAATRPGAETIRGNDDCSVIATRPRAVASFRRDRDIGDRELRDGEGRRRIGAWRVKYSGVRAANAPR